MSFAGLWSETSPPTSSNSLTLSSGDGSDEKTTTPSEELGSFFVEQQRVCALQRKESMGSTPIGTSIDSPGSGEFRSAFANESSLRSQGFTVEEGGREGDTPSALLEADRDVPVYDNLFRNAPHVNYTCSAEDGGPIIVSVESSSTENTNKRALIRNIGGEFLVEVVAPPNGFKDDGSILDKLVSDFGATYRLSQASFLAVSRPEDHTAMCQHLVAYENKVTRILRYKFGVLYVRAGQADENVWFANNDPPAEFYSFLDCLGDRIALLGHTGYTGGLNTKMEGVTGTHSYYSRYRGLELMFHVAPLLPYLPLDTQQVERKRHHGNDVVIVVYHDTNNPVPGATGSSLLFDPTLLQSHFNHIFLVVQPVSGDPSHYAISVCTKPGVGDFPPLLGGATVSTDNLKEILLLKCVNGERTAMHMGEFEALWVKTREITLTGLIDNFSESATKLGLTRAQAAKKKMWDVRKQSGDAVRAAGQKAQERVRAAQAAKRASSTPAEFHRITVGESFDFQMACNPGESLIVQIEPPGLMDAKNILAEGLAGAGSDVHKDHSFQKTAHTASRSSLAGCTACGKMVRGMSKAANAMVKCSVCGLRVHVKCTSSETLGKCSGNPNVSWIFQALQPGFANVNIKTSTTAKVVRSLNFQIISSFDFGDDLTDAGEGLLQADTAHDTAAGAEPNSSDANLVQPLGIIGGARVLAARQSQNP
jgi:hypothetical protein